MFEKLTGIGDFLRDISNPLDHNIEIYSKMLEEIDKIDLGNKSDSELKKMSSGLRKQAGSGYSYEKLTIDAFALVREAARRVLGVNPFDVQLIAGLAMERGKLVEMKTGEGKTLAAVFPAYLNALSGKGVHILTFNDYLAERDARWMGPIFDFLGLAAGHIVEGMGMAERQQAYLRDITYLTAKEAGFDYLRDFLCNDRAKCVQRSFNYAIVDEADSILIDEARIPLVIAGESDGWGKDLRFLCNIAKGLEEGKDYEIDQHGRNISLTEQGLARVEVLMGCGNLYEPQNLELLARLNCALHAEFLLERDRDYIVRNGKVELVDEFTGRVAHKRHWPDNLHAAVEVKEGIENGKKGTVMGLIALQHFLSLYPKLSGMTGTAASAAAEFREFYCMDVVMVPTNKPCRRIDHPNVIFAREEDKKKAVVSEIIRVHKTGRPILIGTCSIAESEELAAALKKEGLGCTVLNAKNDRAEAKVVAEAGELGSVTVSTNMAGRGVDIRLGGRNEKHREKVIALGGLYVIGTSLYESRRIDDQLRGRAGRQGEPGESRFFVSLEDELIRNYSINRLIPEKCCPSAQGEIMDETVRRAVERGQKMAEGYNSDIRRQLWKYSYIVEQQRRIIHKKREEVLLDAMPPKLLEDAAAHRYSTLCGRFGRKVLERVEKQLTLYFINKCWADYLDYVSYIREGIHLVVIGNKDPLAEFHKLVIQAFDEMLGRIDEEIIEAFNTAEIDEGGIDMKAEGLMGPSATWTYLVDDSPDMFSNLPLLVKGILHFAG